MLLSREENCIPLLVFVLLSIQGWPWMDYETLDDFVGGSWWEGKHACCIDFLNRCYVGVSNCPCSTNIHQNSYSCKFREFQTLDSVRWLALKVFFHWRRVVGRSSQSGPHEAREEERKVDALRKDAGWAMAGPWLGCGQSLDLVFSHGISHGFRAKYVDV